MSNTTEGPDGPETADTPERGIRTLCYFEGASVEQLRDALAEYQGSDVRVKVQQVVRAAGGMTYELLVCDASGQGDPINDSHLCPGSPGC